MEQSNAILTQAADLVRAGKKKQAADLLRELLQAEPGNVRAWGILSMAVDAVEERREALQAVEQYGDDRMATWARQQMATLPPLPAPAQFDLGFGETTSAGSLADFQIPAAPSAPGTELPTQKPPAQRARRLVMIGVIVLAVACLLLIVALLLPAIQNYQQQLANQPTPTPTQTPTETPRPVRPPRSTPAAASTQTAGGPPADTPAPAGTEGPTPTATPTSTATATLTPADSLVAGGYKDLKQRKLASALNKFNQAVVLNPKLVAAFVGRASVYLENKSWSAATTDMNAALRLEPDNVEANLLVGDIAYHQGDYIQASALYTQVIQQHPDSPLPYNKRGDALFKQGNPQSALSDYQQALSIDPSFAAAVANVGNVAYQRGDYKSACDSYGKAIGLDPDQPLFYSEYGDCLLWGSKDFENARANYDKALAINTALDFPHLGRGDVLYAQEKFNDALVEYNIAARAGSSDPARLYSQRGLTYSHLGSYTPAVNDFASQLKLGDNACAYVNRCQAYNGLRNFKAAIDDCTAAINQNGPSAGLFDRAVAYDATGEFEKALADYTQYISSSPTLEDALNYAQDRVQALSGGTPTAKGAVSGFPHATCEAH